MHPAGPYGALRLYAALQRTRTMTTIVYHGPSRSIYSDSLVTTSDLTATSRIEALVKVEDLTRFKLKKSKGERFLAAGFAGSLGKLESALKFTLSNFRLWNGAVSVGRSEGLSVNHLNGVSVLLVTDKHVYTLHFSADGVKANTYKPTDTIAIGSGGRAAETAMSVYGANGLDALCAAALCDEATGSLANIHRITDKGVVYETPVLMDTSVEGRKQMRKRSAKSTYFDPHVYVHGSKIHKTSIVKMDDQSRWIKELNVTFDRRNERAAENAKKAREERAAAKTAKIKKPEETSQVT